MIDRLPRAVPRQMASTGNAIQVSSKVTARAAATPTPAPSPLTSDTTNNTATSTAPPRQTSPAVDAIAVSRTNLSFAARRNMTRWAATGAVSSTDAVAVSTSVATYRSRCMPSKLVNRIWNGMVSRNASRICTPVCATRSSCSISA